MPTQSPRSAGVPLLRVRSITHSATSSVAAANRAEAGPSHPMVLVSHAHSHIIPAGPFDTPSLSTHTRQMGEERAQRRKKELLDAVRQARAEFEALQDEVDGAKDGYHEAVRSLNEAGMPLREIAEHLGLSHQRVHQMLTGESRRSRGKKVARGLGAAGVLIAVILSSAALLREPATPLPRIEERKVTLVQQPAPTRNDIAEVHRYEEAIATGRVAGKRWRFLVSHLGGIYCSRFRWSPGPRHQGEICGPIPPREQGPLEPGDLALAINPVQPDDPDNPVPVAHGHIPSRRPIEITLETCEGAKIETRVFYEPELAMTFFMAFLPKGAERAQVRAVGLDGISALLSRSNACPE